MSFGDGTSYARSMEAAHDSLIELIRTMRGAGKLDASQADTLEAELDALYVAEDEWFDLQTDSEEAWSYLESSAAILSRYDYAAPIVVVINSAIGVASDVADQADLESVGTIAAGVVVESVNDAGEIAKTSASLASNPYVIAGVVVAAASVALVILRAEVRAVLRS